MGGVFHPLSLLGEKFRKKKKEMFLSPPALLYHISEEKRGKGGVSSSNGIPPLPS